MKKFTALLLMLVLGGSVAGAQGIDVLEESNNPQFSALVKRLKLGECQADTYGAYLDTDDDYAPYDLDFAANKAVNAEIIQATAEAAKESGDSYKLIKTVTDTPISFVHLIDVGGDKLADRYVYLSGYEFNEWCILK